MILIKGKELLIHNLFEIPFFFFVNFILLLFCMLSLSFIAKGLAMCRLGDVISA